MNWLKRWRGEKMGKPNIRFKGYTEDWEQRKLGDFGKATGGTSIESEFSEDGIYKVISIGSYSENSVYNDQGIRAIKSDKTSNRVLNRNDLTMILNDKTTSGNIIGRVLLIEESGIYVYNQRTERIEINLDEYDPVFLYEMLNAPNIREKIIKQAQGNTQIYVNWTAISLLEYMIPSKEEQVKIGEYLHSISNLITLHQRKYDETKKLKKCMLQKMFPKEGEKVPEIRFSGFTGDWKQRKLGEIVNRITRKNSKLISELPLTISAQQGLIVQNEFFDKRVASKDVSGYYLIKNGEFAYNKSTSNDAPWGAIKRLDRYENGVLSTLYIVFEIKDETLVNSDFLVAYYSTNLWYKGIHEIAAEGARNHGLLNIAPTDFFKTKLKLPADIEEQQEIGEYFKKIDSLITFHHRKSNLFNKTCRNAWEQRKLGDVAEYRNGKAHENEIDDDGEYIVVNSKFVSTNGEIKKFSNAQNEPLYENEIAFVLSDVPNGRAIARTFLIEKSGKYTLNQRIAGITPHEDTDPYYLHIKMNRNAYFLKFDDGNKQTNLSIKDVLNYEDMYPNYKEQQKIGNYFRSLDHLITLHQQKCKQLQIIRKFMLQNIFL